MGDLAALDVSVSYLAWCNGCNSNADIDVRAMFCVTCNRSAWLGEGLALILLNGNGPAASWYDIWVRPFAEETTWK